MTQVMNFLSKIQFQSCLLSRSYSFTSVNKINFIIIILFQIMLHGTACASSRAVQLYLVNSVAIVKAHTGPYRSYYDTVAVM